MTDNRSWSWEDVLKKQDTLIEQTYKQCGENILEELIKIENERWEDAKHCTCLGYAIIQVAGGDDGDIDELERRLKLMRNKQ
jgi:hypothetical protein